ncbi:PucR family transcriptional regulator [Bacillus sp. NEB1478]|uniref:PucR family transcriptional regulator n=1 Tax=Bacillus sp. NEB1478 TaxID=3073816 RepID=UPI0028735CE1|nr:PucR family transcriptional regulator [Bacillus sp. NEB1478]WNB93347.1 PucR family transcriptional regulator [Bacillus sp. NEB1478]
MQNHSSLAVKDILYRDHFDKTIVIAGFEGLTRQVKWVHVVEVPNIKKLLNGNELILSTGVVWKDNPALLSDFLQQLIDCGAAGLCIEIGTYTSSIPKEVVDLANLHRFPIILFLEEVQFVNITQDIHAQLINQHYQMIQDLEEYSQKLNKKLLTFENRDEMLKLMYEYTGLHIIMNTTSAETIFLPECSEETKLEVRERVLKNQESPFLVKQSLQVMEQQYGEIFIFSKEREINEFDQLILDRTTTALSQLFLRELYVEETKRTEKYEWINNWLDGGYSEKQTMDNLFYHEGEMSVNGGTVAICKIPQQTTNADLTYLILFIRSIFEQQGFHLITTERQGYFVYILLNKRGVETWKQRLKNGMDKVHQTDFLKKHKCKFSNFAVGQYNKKLAKIGKSYETAVETFRLQKNSELDRMCIFYEDLHMYRVISLFKQQENLHEMMREYLSPVIEYDRKYNGKLMQTLKAYLACSGSKKETAKKLFVVRQTLYYRIEKLERLLGKDFITNFEKRLAIELMLFVNDYLFSSESMQNVKTKEQVTT